MEEKNYIPGIYNYCDRWCEKCSFTSRCLLFTNESKIATHEILNNGDLSSLKDIFPDSIPEEENDFDDEFIFEENDEDPDQELPEILREDFDMSNHPLDILLDEYFQKAHFALTQINNRYDFYTPSTDKLQDDKYRKLFTNFETVSWYHTLILTKTRRSIMGKNDLLKEDDEELKEFTQMDIDGSAKVAVIGIKNSIESLNILFTEIHEFHDEISELLIIAGKLLNELEQEFPGYKFFKRPGFDD